MNLMSVSQKELTEVTAIRVFITDTLNRPELNSNIVQLASQYGTTVPSGHKEICHNLCYLNDGKCKLYL